jgi:hypothetical protein
MAVNQPMTPTGFEPEIQDITRQRELSKLLLQQGLQGNLQGQMVSGRYVPSHPLEGIANVYSAYKGRQLAKEADTKQAQLAELIRKGTTEDMLKYGELMYGKQGTPEIIPQGQTLLDDQGQVTMGSQRGVAPVQANPRAAYEFATQSRFPQVSSMATEMVKPQKLGPDETIQRFNPSTGKYEVFGQGVSKLPPDVQGAVIFLGLDKKPREQWTQQDLLNIERKANEFKRSGASSTVVNTEKSYGQAFGQGLAGNDVKLYDSASRAPQMLETVKETRALLNNDKLYVGFGANQKLDLARAADAFGITGRDTAEKISNTQRLFANRAQATLDSVKESGLGAGNGFTDKDREFLEKSKLGNIVYSRDALKQQLDIEERVARGLAQKWNTRFDQIPDSAKGPTGVTKVELTKSVVESLSGADREAYDWATKNPNDPRASQIMRRLGLK